MIQLSLDPAHVRAGVVLLTVFGVTFGLACPFVATVATERGLKLQIADATIRSRSGQVLATSLSGTAAERPGYFWGRIYQINTLACSRPTDGLACAEAVARRRGLLTPNTGGTAIPQELLDFSDSPLRTDIGLAAALYQVPRIAAVRGLPEARVAAIVRASVHNSIFNTTKGLYVNLLELNLKLDGKLS